ncbi:MAG: L-threonylcarbamoyladenylate synthase [Parasphingorhabdus sp.]
MGIVKKAAAHLRSGGLVAVPTETVYGLAADATNAEAVAQIYRTKGRPDFNPLIVHVPNLDVAQQLGTFNSLARTIAEKYWPGPMTLVLPKTEECKVAAAVTAGLETIAIRCPKHPVMRNLLNESELYLAAPSANKSGGISPTTADHVREGLGTDQLMILDGGACEQGLESTIVAVREGGYQVLRPGPVTKEMLIELTGQHPIEVSDAKIEAPGQLAKHYAPSKPVRLNVEQAGSDEYHIGFGDVPGDLNLSETGDLAQAAANLFAFLHFADSAEQSRIAVAPIPENAMGRAINDRLRRAATRS